MKKVGVIIPFYNTPLEYMKECLKSVAVQTYKNLEIVLVNDSSTHQDCVSLAMQYVQSDERFVLIDKSENGGQSQSRNIGLNYLANCYQLELSKQVGEIGEFEVQNDSGINKIYKKAFNPPPPLVEIDYLIFLDSDDYWSVNCIEECIRHSDGVDIVWFNTESFLSHPLIEVPKQSRFCKYGFKNQCISSYEWLQQTIKIQERAFSFVADGMIDWKFFQEIGLKFEDGIIFEDRLFGVLLFSQARKIYALDLELYHYRLHDKSVCSYAGKCNLSTSQEKLLQFFTTQKQAWRYHYMYSHIVILERLIEFSKKDLKTQHYHQQLFFPFYLSQLYGIFCLRADPYHLKNRIKALDFIPWYWVRMLRFPLVGTLVVYGGKILRKIFYYLKKFLRLK